MLRKICISTPPPWEGLGEAKNGMTMKIGNKFWEVTIRIVIAALTAALTAITTTSCMGHGPITF